ALSVRAREGGHPVSVLGHFVLGPRLRGDERKEAFCGVLGGRTVPPIDSRGALAAGRDETARREEAREPSSSALPRTPLFIVASPRPQVGKTFLARLLTDFLSLDGGSVFAFEIEPGTDALADYLPDI